MLQLNQLLYDEKNMRMQQTLTCKCGNPKALTLLNEENNQLREMRRKFEGAQQRVMDLECENARLVEEFMHTNNEKEAKIKDLTQANSQLKNEIRSHNVRLKDIECELTKVKNEVEVERSKRHEAEAAIKNESLLRQAYDRISASLKNQKGHIDELQRSNQDLYQVIDRLKDEISDKVRLLGEKDAKVEGLQKEVKKVMGEKCDKESLIKTLTQENLRLANECLELHQDGKVNIYLRQEIETLKEKVATTEQKGTYMQQQF